MHIFFWEIITPKLLCSRYIAAERWTMRYLTAGLHFVQRMHGRISAIVRKSANQCRVYSNTDFCTFDPSTTTRKRNPLMTISCIMHTENNNVRQHRKRRRTAAKWRTSPRGRVGSTHLMSTSSTCDSLEVSSLAICIMLNSKSAYNKLPSNIYPWIGHLIPCQRGMLPLGASSLGVAVRAAHKGGRPAGPAPHPSFSF